MLRRRSLLSQYKLIQFNRFPTGNSTSMPGLKIFWGNTDQSKAKNIKLFNDAQQWRSDYISHNGLSDTGQGIRINIDELMIDNIIMDKYDGNYRCYIYIYEKYFYLYLNGVRILEGGGSFESGYNYYYYHYNIFPSPLETKMLFLRIDTYYKSDNIKLYNNAIQWRKDYISYNGLNDTGQPISMFVDRLYIDNAHMDEYDRYYHYHIDIYNDRIILLNDSDSSEVLTIYSDGSFTILDIFNKFPSPTNIATIMPGLKIYTDNTTESKSKNIKLYNDAKRWRKDRISYCGESDTGQLISMVIDVLIIDDETIDKYDRDYHYNIDIYNDHIILLNDSDSLEVLTISSDGSVDIYIPEYITPTP